MEKSLEPLRMIRIVKDLKQDEMAQYFLVTGAYIGAVEKNKKEMNIRTLKYGLDNLGIDLHDYFSLEQFGKDLELSEMIHEDKFKFMMIKTLGVTNPELREKTEELLDSYLHKKTI